MVRVRISGRAGAGFDGRAAGVISRGEKTPGRLDASPEIHSGGWRARHPPCHALARHGRLDERRGGRAGRKRVDLVDPRLPFINRALRSFATFAASR